MRFLASWESCFLLLNIPITALKICDVGLAYLGDVACKIISYLWWFLVGNTTSLLAVFATDRAVSMRFSTWHYKKNWTKLNKRITVWITAFNLIVSIPILFLFKLEEDECELTSLDDKLVRAYNLFLNALFTVVYNFVILCSAVSLVASFRAKILRRRTERGILNTMFEVISSHIDVNKSAEVLFSINLSFELSLSSLKFSILIRKLKLFELFVK